MSAARESAISILIAALIVMPVMADLVALQQITAIYAGPTSSGANLASQQLSTSDENIITIEGSVGYGDLNVLSNAPWIINVRRITNDGKTADTIGPVILTVSTDAQRSDKKDLWKVLSDINEILFTDRDRSSKASSGEIREMKAAKGGSDRGQPIAIIIGISPIY